MKSSRRATFRGHIGRPGSLGQEDARQQSRRRRPESQSLVKRKAGRIGYLMPVPESDKRRAGNEV
jgi:hypothetical protein